LRTKAISTGAKHLALDISKIDKPIQQPEIKKSDNIEIECFGCSS
jgi:hypothetical protein